MAKKKSEKLVVLFVEGETEFVFFNKLIAFLKNKKENKDKKCNKYKIINVRGVGNYALKAPAKFKHEIKPKFPSFFYILFCAYDTDVFQFSGIPPVNWQKVEKTLKKYGAKKVYHIKAEKMIEDWFLTDLEGLCSFLKLKKILKPKGKDGNEKMKALFKKGNKIYQKGSYSHKFLESLDLQKIYTAQNEYLSDLEKELFDLEDIKQQ